MFAQRSTLPEFSVFSEPHVPSSRAPVPPSPDNFQTMGMGALGRVASPGLAALGSMRGTPDGLGAIGQLSERGSMVVGLIAIGVIGALSYQVGKAVAPRGANESTWGWVAVPLGLLTGPVGLGVMAIAANQKG